MTERSFPLTEQHILRLIDRIQGHTDDTSQSNSKRFMRLLYSTPEYIETMKMIHPDRVKVKEGKNGKNWRLNGDGNYYCSALMKARNYHALLGQRRRINRSKTGIRNERKDYASETTGERCSVITGAGTRCVRTAKCEGCCGQHYRTKTKTWKCK